MELKLFQTDEERLRLGVQGNFPEHLMEQKKDGSEIKQPINESLTRPWIRHYFLIQFLRKTNATDDIVTRDLNIIDIFRTTIPLVENSFIESALNSWQMFLGSAFRDADTPWYTGIKRVMVTERFSLMNLEHSYLVT